MWIVDGQALLVKKSEVLSAFAVAIIGIPIMSTQVVGIDAYVIDVLMSDLVGHDRSPAAFIVYLFLLRTTIKSRRESVAISLQTIATKTGLSKSTVQLALRRLARRKLIDSSEATISNPVRRVLRPWTARRASFG